MKLDLRIESITLDELTKIMEFFENDRTVIGNDGERISEGKSLGYVLYAEITPGTEFPDRAEITRSGVTVTYYHPNHTPDHADGL